MNPLLRCSLVYLTTGKKFGISKNTLQHMHTNSFSRLNNNDDLNVNWISKLDTNNHVNQTSFLSWNILSQNLFDSTPKWYMHVKSEVPVSWVERFPRIVSEILESGADVVCLQEVEFTAYEKDFQSTMYDNGYSSLMQKSSRKRAEEGGYGVATFWRKDRFQLRDSIHRSRTMVTILSDVLNPGSCLAVINCHLEGHPEKSLVRVRQLQRW
jgi:mRNA deadenylase 3'-5' endonuclease subunit Ccr4